MRLLLLKVGLALLLWVMMNILLLLWWLLKKPVRVLTLMKVRKLAPMLATSTCLLLELLGMCGLGRRK